MVAVHTTARELYRAGLMHGRTMREFDLLCLQKVRQYSAAQIKRIRERKG